jgi:hypothetical protein
VEWNQQAYQQLTCPKELVVIPGAGHQAPDPLTLLKSRPLWSVTYQYRSGPD